MLEHYILNFLFTTLGVIVLLYGVYLYLKQNPNFNAKLSKKHLSNDSGTDLVIDSILDLEPRKRLYVVRYGEERFLISTGPDKTEFLTILKTEPVSNESIIPSSEEVTLKPETGFIDRFRQSLKMVLFDRLTPPGGR